MDSKTPANDVSTLNGAAHGDGHGVLANPSEMAVNVALPDGLPAAASLPPLNLPPLPKRRLQIPRFDLHAHRVELIALVLAVVVSLLFVPQVRHFSHRNDAERIINDHLPFWQTLENWEYSL